MILKEQNGKYIYSDGDTAEQKMLKIATEYPEDLSQEYISQNSEYLVNSTFSAVRQNILNWYPFKPNAEILEIGAGMGSITGMLCDKASYVTAVEMNPDRAAVIKARYPERENLEIISENIFDWNTEKKFDYIIMIGVLEYAGVFSEQPDPYTSFLMRTRELLKTGGRLLFAIENRFGIKYFLGASEDHLQQPYVGIEGYKQPKTPRTFSKHELGEFIKGAGYNSNRFYYVYPDYKFPELICTDEYAPSYSSLKKISFTYAKNSALVLDEKDIYKDLIENDVWQFMANSYLVEAWNSNQNENTNEQKVYYVSAKGETQKKYRVSTVIMNDGYAYKIPMHSQAEEHIQRIYENTKCLKERGISVLEVQQEGRYLKTQMFNGLSGEEYVSGLLEQNDKVGFFRVIELLRDTLLKTSELEFEKNILSHITDSLENYHIGPVLKDGYIDMTFYNCFYQDDKLLFYDQEWKFPNVPLNFILFYAVKSLYNRRKIKTQISFDEVMDFLGIGEERNLYDKLEEYIWSQILYRQTDFYGEDGYCNRFQEKITLSRKFQEIDERSKEKLEKIKIRKEEEIKEIRIQNKEKVQELERQNEEKIQEIEDLRKEQINHVQEIERLIPIENEYQFIIRSKMYKIMRFLCRILDIFLIIPRAVWRNIRAFARMMTHVNWQEIKIAYGYCKNEGILNAYRHLMRDYHQGELKQIEVDATPVYEEIQTLEECETLELPVCENPVVSIVIPAYNQFTYTYHCIEAIIKNTDGMDYEVILADDNSSDLTKDIGQIVHNLKIARTETNLMFLRNCNQAAQKASGKYIVFLNNDTQVQKNWLKPLTELMEADEKIGLAGSKLVYADGTLQEAGGIIWSDGNGWNYGRNDDAMKPEYNYVREVDYISGASIMIRKSLWNEIGGFDERFAPAYCEDSDLAFQVRQRGYKVVYQPLSVVVHYEGKSNGTDTSQGVKKYQIENSIKLKEKWRNELKLQYDHGVNVFNARERAGNKKTILVIDHYVPQFDKDAGSKTTWQYLKMFVKQGYRVKFIGDNFYQHEPYTTLLQQMGIEVLYGPWYAQHWQEWILDNKDSIEFAYLNRPHITIKYIDFLKEKTNIKCIYYGHDLHFLRLRREYELTGDESKNKEAEEWLEKELYIMRRADMTYYPSCVEVQEIKKIDPAIPVKAITAYVYEKFLTDINLDFAKREGIIFVGGFGHPPNEDAVLWFTGKILPLIEQKKKMTFYIVGSNPSEKINSIQNENVVVKGFVSEEELRNLYNQCKLVVVPLRYGAGVKGKVVEALYYGSPMVTTSVGIEGIEGADQIIEVADKEEEFAESVLRLYEDDRKLAAISDSYQRFVKDRFSVAAVWDIIKEDFA